MKMMFLETIGIIGGMSILGYMYLKKHPEEKKKMKKNIKEISRTVYNKLDMED